VTKDHNLLNFLNNKWDKIDAKIESDPLHTDGDIEMAKKNRAKQLNGYKNQLGSITECLDNTSESYQNSEFLEKVLNSGDIIFLCSDGVYQ
jgi:serine/threonine protein phosphatase PrpC